MKTSIETKKILTLTMDEFEVRWLKAVMQNRPSDSESAQDEAMRNRFWNALNEIDSKHK